MDANTIAPPPPGFVLDKPVPVPPPPSGFTLDSAPKAVPPPPAGFQVDVPATKPQGRGIWQAVKDYPAHLAEGLVEQFKLPGDVMSGKKRLDTPEGMDEAVGLGTSIALGRLSKKPENAGVTKPARADSIRPAEPAITIRSTPEAMRSETPPPPPGFTLDTAPAAAKNALEHLDLKAEQTKVADDLFKLRQTGTADRIETSKRLDQVPEQFRNAPTQERWYHAMEEPALIEKLPPEERAVFDQHIVPMRQEINQLYSQIKGLDPTFEDQSYVHRIAKGHAPQYDMMSGDAYDPVAGTKSLSRTTSALKERKFMTIENPVDGRRFVVSKADNGFDVWRDGKPTRVSKGVELQPGTEVTLDGQQWNVGQARTAEIEANSDVRYHKNAAVNTADALVRMRQVARNMQEVDRLKTDLLSRGLAQKLGEGRGSTDGFRETRIPQFRGIAFEPKIANALDDFYKPGLDGLEGLRKINQFATGSIFWNPIPHVENVAAHWFVARGFDWVRPGPLRHFATDASRAIKSAVTQDADYVRLLKKGSALVEGGIKNADFYQAMGKKFGMDIEKNWGSWKPTFDKLGLKTPYEAIAWWYDKMRNVLWTSSDVFMLHRVFELERKGLSAETAIKDAEKHIPNYRIPPEVLGSRTFSRILQDPAVTVFSRYHYGMWKSYMNMLGDLYKGGSKEKLETLGNMAALGVLLYGVYPAVDYALQKLTGDDKAKKLRRGASSVPGWIKDMYDGDLAFPQFLSNVITIAPATKEGMQQFVGKDWFTGQDMGGAVPRTEHAAQGLVSPYQTFNQIMSDKRGSRSAGRGVFDMAVGAANTSERTLRGKEKGKKIRDKAARTRDNKPRGLIEKGVKAVKGLYE